MNNKQPLHLPRRKVGLGFQEEQDDHEDQGKITQNRSSSSSFHQIRWDFTIEIDVRRPRAVGVHHLVSKYPINESVNVCEILVVMLGQ
jgi:hypothetical protein